MAQCTQHRQGVQSLPRFSQNPGYCHSKVAEKGGAEAEQNSQGWSNPSALQPLVGHAGEFCVTDEIQYTAWSEKGNGKEDATGERRKIPTVASKTGK